MAAKASLEDYPALARWYAERQGRVTDQRPEQLVLGTCDALRRERRAGVQAWLASFRAFLANATDPLGEFLVAEATMQRCDVEMMDLIGDLASDAVRSHEGAAFLAAMQAGADVTGLVVFRFLAAWTALNEGDPETCVEECEKVTDPFASVHTLHGQALLELGRAKDALDALEVATKLGPSELLAWFQKAKALHVLGRHLEAFQALRACLRLAPGSDEVAFYMGLIAVETSDAGLWRESWTAFRPRLARVGGTALATLALLRLAILLGKREDAHDVVAESPWTGDITPGETTRMLADVLKRLGECGWMDVAHQLLGKVTARTA
jgi:tetratricopeptide (TPR) repeat protein